MCKFFLICFAASLVFPATSPAQSGAANPTKPDQHVLGTVTAVDSAAQKITVKDDKTGSEFSIALANTKTLLKVPPGAKDLKSATRITANDLATGDRVDIRGFKVEGSPNSIAAASVILMSARDLQAARQAELADWRTRGIAGIATSVDGTAHILEIRVRTPEGPKPVVVNFAAGTQFTRFSPEHPKTAVPSQLTDIQPGDQVRILGNKSPDGSTIVAEKVYSGSFRTIPGIIVSISPDGKSINVKDLQTNQPTEITLTDDSAVRKLPPQMAVMLASHVNPNSRQGAPAGNQGSSDSAAGAPTFGAKAGEANSSSGGRGMQPSGSEANSSGPTGSRGFRNGDISQMIERLPKISVSDLKPGDAVVISGATGPDKSHLIATNIIAGVEPVFQTARPRAGRSVGGDWNLDMAIPSQ